MLGGCEMDPSFRLPSADMIYSSEIQRTATNAASTEILVYLQGGLQGIG
jgi:hypothetical protein